MILAWMRQGMDSEPWQETMTKRRQDNCSWCLLRGDTNIYAIYALCNVQETISKLKKELEASASNIPSSVEKYIEKQNLDLHIHTLAQTLQGSSIDDVTSNLSWEARAFPMPSGERKCKEFAGIRGTQRHTSNPSPVS